MNLGLKTDTKNLFFALLPPLFTPHLSFNPKKWACPFGAMRHGRPRPGYMISPRRALHFPGCSRGRGFTARRSLPWRPNGPFFRRPLVPGPGPRMPLSLSPARVFAELVVPPVTACPGRDNKEPPPAGGIPGSVLPPGREVHVSGSAELSAAPDRAQVTVHLRSRKGEAGAARDSVARRLDYVAQTARQRGGVSVGGS